MKATDLRLSDHVLVRLDGRERRAVVHSFKAKERARGGTVTQVLVVLEKGERIWVSTRRIVRRVGRGAFARVRASRGSDARTTEGA